MDTIARCPDMARGDRATLVDAVPSWQWRGPFWPELALHCGARVVAPLTPYNSDDAFGICPERGLSPRCLSRSPDGRGMAWILSGGSVADYGACSQRRCPRCVEVTDGD